MTYRKGKKEDQPMICPIRKLRKSNLMADFPYKREKKPFMKKFFILALITLLSASCEKEEFDLLNPAVDLFVKQLKNGTYNYFEEQWLILPDFNESHIQALIDFSRDTFHIPNFPINSLVGNPLPEGRDYFILGECLLWVVEGIRNELDYASFDPFLIDTGLAEAERIKGITGKGVLTVSELYKDWWNSFKGKDWKVKNPLENSPYRWFQE